MAEREPAGRGVKEWWVNLVLLAIGVLLLLVVDLLWTTLWADGGAGPLSSRLGNVLWRGIRRTGASDEALTLVRYGTPEQGSYNGAVVENTRSSVESCLSTLHQSLIEPADRTPPPPALEALREAGIPTVDDATFATALDELDGRRRRLLGVVQADAWTWSEDER